MSEKILRPNPGVADRRVTVSSSVVTLSGTSALATFDGMTEYVVIDVQAQPIMVTFDYSDPTSSNGHLMSAGDKAVWSVGTARAAKFIRQGGTDGTVHASEFTD